MPLGELAQKSEERLSWFWSHNHSEFVTYKDSQTALRYLVRIRESDHKEDENEDDEEEEEEEEEVQEEESDDE